MDVTAFKQTTTKNTLKIKHKIVFLRRIKDGKAYVERVPGSERVFEHLTERDDVVVS